MKRGLTRVSSSQEDEKKQIEDLRKGLEKGENRGKAEEVGEGYEGLAEAKRKFNEGAAELKKKLEANIRSTFACYDPDPDPPPPGGHPHTPLHTPIGGGGGTYFLLAHIGLESRKMH